jgi:imidazolonepropionase-like amidohydrolase
MSRVVFKGGTVLDGTGAAPAPGDVVIEDDRIVDVGVGLDGDDAIDCQGRAVLPGLFDCHVHVMSSGPDLLGRLQTPFSYRFFEAERNLRSTLDTGITSVRDAGGADLGVKKAVADGLVAGPRMQIALVMLSQTGGHGDGWMPCGTSVALEPHPGRPSAIVDGPDEMRRKVREVIRAGADVIKVATSGGVLSPRDDPRHGHFRDAELAVLADEAAAAGLAVMAHAQATDGIKSAVRAGFRSIEHGIYLDDEAIAMMLERGTWLVPTLVAPRAVLEAADAGASLTQAAIDKARGVIDAHNESFRRAVDAGVRVAMGTDSGVGPHGTNLRELALMEDLSAMTPLDAWVATTSSAAKLLGVADRLGTLEPGKVADVVVLDGDPMDLEKLGTRVVGVWQAGLGVVDRSAA